MATGMDVVISQANVEDAPQILALQRLAFQSEAALYDDYAIPPLTQTLEQLEGEFETHLILKAVMDARIIGSVRGCMKEASCYIGRLMVHPDYQERGIGKRLMAAIEAQMDADRFELFTGDRSAANLKFYHALGYREISRAQSAPKISMVCLEKARNSAALKQGVDND